MLTESALVGIKTTVGLFALGTMFGIFHSFWILR